MQHKFFKRSKGRRFRQNRIVIAGCGQVGLALVEHHPNIHFNATYRAAAESPCDTQKKRTAIALKGARPVQIELNNQTDLKRLATLGHRVIWLAPPNPHGPADFSLSRFAAQLAYRALLYNKPTPQITYISTTGVYGNAKGHWVNEKTICTPESARAKRRVSDEKQLRNAVKKHAVYVHILRAPGIYSAKRLPLERLRKGIPALLAAQDSWSNHIHELDLARLAMWVNYKGAALEIVNACDNQPCKMGDYFDAVAQAFHLPKPQRFNRETVQSMVSPMMWSFMAESRKIESLGIARLRFKLRYPSIESFLKNP